MDPNKGAEWSQGTSWNSPPLPVSLAQESELNALNGSMRSGYNSTGWALSQKESYFCIVGNRACLHPLMDLTPSSRLCDGASGAWRGPAS